MKSGVNAKDKEGWTTSHWAARNGNVLPRAYPVKSAPRKMYNINYRKCSVCSGRGFVFISAGDGPLPPFPLQYKGYSPIIKCKCCQGIGWLDETL